MTRLSILVIEDDEDTRMLMAPLLREHSVTFAADALEARKKLTNSHPDLCLIDLRLGRNDEECSGLQLISLAKRQGAYSVVMSSHDTDQYVETATTLGADGFFAKGPGRLKANVEEILSRFKRKKDASRGEDWVKRISSTSDSDTVRALNEVGGLSTSDIPILILGPSGTGKSHLARMIHERSGRSGEFVEMNCSTSTPELMEGDLFGYKKGAFTGANEDRKGKLLLADGGTLFLDELGAMSVAMQEKLLKAIEEKTFYPVGSDKPEKSQFRLISATLEDLSSLIKAGRLRLDFFQRVHGLTIRLKPLADRPNDILPLIQSLTAGKRRLLFTEDAKRRLCEYSWPGNIRELLHFLELALASDETRFNLDAVNRVFSKLSITDEVRLTTSMHYRYAKEHGLEATLKRFADELVARSLAENDGKKTRVITDLKTNPRTAYKCFARLKMGGLKS